MSRNAQLHSRSKVRDDHAACCHGLLVLLRTSLALVRRSTMNSSHPMPPPKVPVEEAAINATLEKQKPGTQLVVDRSQHQRVISYRCFAIQVLPSPTSRIPLGMSMRTLWRFPHMGEGHCRAQYIIILLIGTFGNSQKLGCI